MLQPKDETSPWEADCWVLACTQEKELFLLQEQWLETRIASLKMTPLIVSLQKCDPICALFF